VVGLLQVFPDLAMVVDLAVDGQDNRLIGVGERLSSAVYRSVKILRFVAAVSVNMVWTYERRQY
jgi:hypothetical protein